jgi:hypothetical protein
VAWFKGVAWNEWGWGKGTGVFASKGVRWDRAACAATGVCGRR